MKIQNNNQQSFKSVELLGRNVHGLPRLEVKTSGMFNLLAIKKETKAKPFDTFEINASRASELATDLLDGRFGSILEPEHLARMRKHLQGILESDLTPTNITNPAHVRILEALNLKDVAKLIEIGKPSYFETQGERKLVLNLYPEMLG